MGTGRLTEEQYNTLVQSYREVPGGVMGAYARAADAAGIDRRVARRAWAPGWDSPAWAMPIAELLQAEDLKVRAKALELEDGRRRAELQAAEGQSVARQHREQASTHAVRQKAFEGQVAMASMANAAKLAGKINQLIDATAPVLEALAEDSVRLIEANRAANRGKVKLTPSERSELGLFVSRTVLATARTNAAIRSSVETVRKAFDDPDQIVRFEHTQLDTDRAVELLGSEEAVNRAAKDMYEGNITEDVIKLMELAPIGGSIN